MKSLIDSITVLGYPVRTSDGWLSCDVYYQSTEVYELPNVNPDDAREPLQRWTVDSIDTAIRYDQYLRKQGSQTLSQFV
jgi:hypothetical protein